MGVVGGCTERGPSKWWRPVYVLRKTIGTMVCGQSTVIFGFSKEA
jgi:hypothetical protein